jgi:predicted amino acid dehydrogenase
MRYLMRINTIHGLGLGAADLLRAPTVSSMAQLIAGSSTGGSATVIQEGREGSTLQTRRRFWRPLPMLRAEGSFDAIDAAAIAYLPDDLLEAARAAGIEALVHHQPKDAGEVQWAGVCRTRLGTIALIVIPRFGNELVADPSIAARASNAALELAGRLGAATAALTGLLPAATDLGRALRPPPGVTITTGHATTASAVVLTAMSATNAVGRRIRDESVSLVGLGAIGTATLRLMLDRGMTPQRLVLCDVPAKVGELKRLAAEVRSAFSYCGALQVVLTSGRVPPEVYQCGLIIGATNMPGVLDVKRLASGTIVVDDSFPHCFDSDLAVRRMTSQGDVLLVEGGFVLPPGPIEWTVALPDNLSSRFDVLLETNLLPLQNTNAITGCILSALLSNSHGATASVGPAGLEACREHWEVLARLGIGAAPLRCGSWSVPEGNLASFRAGGMTGA